MKMWKCENFEFCPFCLFFQSSQLSVVERSPNELSKMFISPCANFINIHHKRVMKNTWKTFYLQICCMANRRLIRVRVVCAFNVGVRNAGKPNSNFNFENFRHSQHFRFYVFMNSFMTVLCTTMKKSTDPCYGQNSVGKSVLGGSDTWKHCAVGWKRLDNRWERKKWNLENWYKWTNNLRKQYKCYRDEALRWRLLRFQVFLVGRIVK